MLNVRVRTWRTAGPSRFMNYRMRSLVRADGLLKRVISRRGSRWDLCLGMEMGESGKTLIDIAGKYTAGLGR